MNEDYKRRAARNEVLLREVNEAIERGLWPGEREARFRCECARLDCNETIELAVAEYERLRRDGRRFVVLAGHEVSEIETVAETHAGYLVVVKRGIAGAVAEGSDPR